MSLIENLVNYKHIYENSIFYPILHSKAFNVVLALLILFILVKLLKFLFAKLTNALVKVSDNEGRRKQIKTLLNFAQTIIVLAFSAMYFMSLLSKMGIDIAPILTAAGVLGVAVGFGAKRLVEDIITGIILLIEGQIQVGDYVKIGAYEGIVERFDLKLVVIRSLSGELHYIRNGMIDVVVNCSRNYMNYMGSIGVSYKENIDNVINVLKEVFNEKLRKNPVYDGMILADLTVLGLDSFDDSAITIRYVIKTKPMCQKIVGREFNRLIKQAFDEKGIEIPFPQRVVHIQKED